MLTDRRTTTVIVDRFFSFDLLPLAMTCHKTPTAQKNLELKTESRGAVVEGTCFRKAYISILTCETREAKAKTKHLFS
jgi:hypothetical protein